jgi:AraC-like DNA-binding protein
MGQMYLEESFTVKQLDHLNSVLRKSRIELISDKKANLIEKVKNIIMELIRNLDEPLKVNLSSYLSEKLNYDYSYLANLFSKEEGITIQSFILSQKIERVKELLIYSDLTLTEISYKLDYSSVGHLSNQFKKVTGESPTSFLASQGQKGNMRFMRPSLPYPNQNPQIIKHLSAVAI